MLSDIEAGFSDHFSKTYHTAHDRQNARENERVIDRRQKNKKSDIPRFTILLEKKPCPALTVREKSPREYRLNHAVSHFAETVRWRLNGHGGYSPEDISGFYFDSVQI